MKNKTTKWALAGVLLTAGIVLALFACTDGSDNGGQTYTVSKASDFKPATAHGDFTIDKTKAKEGETITLTLEPDEGYILNRWTLVPTSTVKAGKDNKYTFIMPAEDVTVKVTFKKGSSGSGQYTITKASTFNPTVAHGDFTIDPESANASDTVTLTPDPDAGYEFSAWTFDPPLAVAPVKTAAGAYTFAMPANSLTVSAAFFDSTGPKFTVTKHTTFNPTRDHGNFTINGEESMSVPAETLITLKPTPDTDYKFGDWLFSPSNITATETSPGSGIWTFNMPSRNVTVIARFLPTKFTLTKGVFANGKFTINDGNEATITVSEGDTVTLKSSADSDYTFVIWGFVPALTAEAQLTEGTAGTWTFKMPSKELTVNAYFKSNTSPHTAGTGTKTMTVKGGLGLPLAWPNKSVGSGGAPSYGMHEGTRDILVTVTMLSGTISSVEYEGSIEWSDWNNFWLTQSQNAALHNAAVGLVAVLNNAKNATANYTPSTNFTGTAASAWNTYDTNIRKAVTDAAAAINEGKPNRVLTGGGEGTPWLVDGDLLNGTATAVGTSFMGGNEQPVNTSTSNPPTDMTVTVTVTNGFITDIEVTTDDLHCPYGAQASGGGVPGGTIITRIPLWIERMKLLNKAEVDTVTGATVNATPYRLKTEKFLKLIGQRAFMKIVNEY